MEGRRGASVELSMVDLNQYWFLPPCQPVTQPDTWTWKQFLILPFPSL